MRIESELHTLDLDDDSISIPKIEFNCILLFPSTEFQKNIRDLSNVAEYVDIVVTKEVFSMSAVGDFATQKLVFSERLNGMQFQSSCDEVISGRFSLKYLNLFAKSSNLSGFVEIYMKNQIPLVLKYTIGSIGRMQFVLSPRP
jgi:proliferating cell nuclear antigen